MSGSSPGDPLAPFLAGGRRLVLDGGLATELEARGHDLDDPLWSARVLLEAPEAVGAVHRSFLEAGADGVATCTYQASFDGLRARGLDDAGAEALLRDAVRIALEAVEAFWEESAHRKGRRRPLVAASVGPYGAYLADGSEYRGDYGIGAAGLRAFHARRLSVLAGAGADLLACETIPSRLEATVLAGLLAETPGARGWISFSCRDETRLSDGTPLGEAVRALEGSPGLVAVGINCTPPELIAPLIAEARAGTSLPVLVYPNAGGRWDARRKVWEAPPAGLDWGAAARAWVAAGASGVGGCCRVRPADIAAVRRALGPA